MITLKLNLSKLNCTEVLALADTVLARLAPPLPETPSIAGLEDETASVQTARDMAFAANKAYEDAKAALVMLKEARDAAVQTLRVEEKALADAVSAKAKGNPVTLSESGFPLIGEPIRSTEPPAKVTGLKLTAAEDGALSGKHGPVARARSYEVQISTRDSVDGPYHTVLQPTRSRWKLTDLESGQRTWVRSRAIGTHGPGPWSDPVGKIVP